MLYLKKLATLGAYKVSGERHQYYIDSENKSIFTCKLKSIKAGFGVS